MSSVIGIYFRFTGGKQKTFKEYLLADKSMSVLPVAFSLMASFMSAITILGVSKENYMFGTQFVVINISYIISTPIVCYLYLPVFFRLQNISVYEYLERRFGLLTRLSASIAFSLQMTLYMGIVLYAPALALSAVTGVSLTWSIIAVGVVCTFYSTLGGMKAVLITDVFQSLLMFVAVFAVVTRGVMDFGVADIFRIASEGGRLEFTNLSPDPRVRHTLWSLGIGGCFTYCSLYGVNQAQVQRLLTIRDLHRAQASLWVQWPILTLLSLSTSFAGLVLYAQYQTCDPIKNGRISQSDQLLPLYVVETMGMVPGLSGLFVSGIFSGSLSTVSSSVNSLAAVTIYDFILPFVPSHLGLKEKQATKISKFFACVYGSICVAVAFLTQLLGTGVLQASLTIFGAVGGPLLSLFTMGMLCKFVNQKGAMSGLILGLVFTLWIGFGQPKPPLPFKPLSTEGCPSVNSTVDIPEMFITEISQNVGNETFVEKILYLSTNDSDVTMLELSTPLSAPTKGITLLPSNLTVMDAPHKQSTPFLHELYAISYMWVAAIGFMTTLVVGVVVSLATGGNDILDPELYSSWVCSQAASISENLCTEKCNLTSKTGIAPVSSSTTLNPEVEEMSHL
ncbi:putative sodium-dependent multivitamin transporter isoform X2 [Homarus americanus]|uniref:putative sodium-dependent multivitamin transporter isoform X2 n=1 Tax=Homarus americanus TaxID=6706 RepID=UPI001C44CC71|nr:putative sodium-dependent multivitamin transporter isoform X2 [Homarus americanus]XP_042240401.1 putative sodium-dependent multivitamin transporter isoform X2 [Homarus americanus]XP_042240402.1 putative sodium-dependent multivitamin transporter isoform X2 [Homarus americanus]XP_042240403.1 putative sodium-dependent multivitamin transporter isoform X2 [Homarus americanus]